MTTRLLGVGLALLAALWLEPGRFDPLHGLVLPLVMAVGAWLAAQNLLVVLLAVGGLALSAAELGSNNWVQSIAYPTLTITSALGMAAILWRRWRQRIADTHDARWAERERRASQAVASVEESKDGGNP